MKQNEHLSLRQRKWFPILTTVMYFLLPAIQYLAVEASSNIFEDIPNMFQVLARIPFYRHLTGYAVILFLNQLLVLLFGRIRIALNLSAVMTTALAVGNLLVHRMHGTPFTFSMLKLAGTALNVLGSYSITLGIRGWFILGLFAVEFVGIQMFFTGVRCTRRKACVPAAVLTLIMVGAYIGPWSWIPRRVVSWSWNDSITNYGYTNCLVQSTLCGLHAAIKPEGYDEPTLQALSEEFTPAPAESKLPDVILILNETFYDLRQISAVDPDTDYLEHIAGLDNCLRGYTVVPEIGGGTNKSEYELLTSNSLHLAPNVTPFNQFDLNGASSVVSHLESLGYETLAIHPANSQNYKRNEGYPALGFDNWHFEEDFKDLTHYKTRFYTSDASLYDNLTRWYEQMGDGPRFAYALTIQNHGGHDQLSPEDMRVNAAVDYGDHDKEVNEFLTCIDLSDEAFVQLTEYFSQQDRDVIVCMMGDHSPIFAPDLVDKDLTDLEKEFHLRSTPYVIWSNCIDLSGESPLPEYLSAIYLTPAMLNLAGIPMSGYYSYLTQLMRQVPVLSDFNYYVTSENELYTYEDNSPVKQAVDTYLGYAYANIRRKPFMVPFTLAANPAA